MEAKLVPVQLKELVNSVINMFKGQAASKGLKILVKIPEKDLLVKTDPHFFSQILTSLVSNAIKFTAQGQITLSIMAEEDLSQSSFVQVRVEDTGMGMTEEELGRIFKPFTQANKNITYQYGGSGLGLFISKRLVELLGGKIDATSQRGKGTQFTFTVRCEPVTEEEKKHFNKQEESVIAEIERSRLRGNKKPILCRFIINQFFIALKILF